MRKLARTLMIQGTASSVGKSLLTAALCRIFHQAGIRVAPFKAQNMSLNSFVTPGGLEIGRAQAVQAEAAGIEPAVEMNPILLKPESGSRSQVVLMGKPAASLKWSQYHAMRPKLVRAIAKCLLKLRREYELVVIEGAGSPAEINLHDRDLVNMHVAAAADAPVLLVGDIDRGGVFAQFVGTMELLEPAEHARIAGFVINKFRGERALLESGLGFLPNRYGIPVLGVIPYIERLRIADEDSADLDERIDRHPAPATSEIEIAVAALSSMSNFDDFLPLEHQPGVIVRFTQSPAIVQRADLAVIPGSKNTLADLEWLRREHLDRAILERAAHTMPILGICGGCQMLGGRIDDPGGVESRAGGADGLGILPLTTRFEKSKRTTRVRARFAARSLLGDGPGGAELTAYEIHMGRVTALEGAAAPFRIVSRNGKAANASDGAIGGNGTIVGTMLHGIFENEPVRRALLDNLRTLKGVSAPAPTSGVPARDAEYDRLAAIVRANADIAAIRRIAGL
ncbi:MAG: cobyric acid synthase [Candidatus Binataceae bacterium]